MKDFLSKIKNGKAVKIIKEVISSRYFPFATAAVMLAFYYLGWDIVSVYYLIITTAAMVLLLDDLTPVLPQFLFFNVIVSVQNSPLSPDNGGAGSDYYTRPAVLIQAGILVALLIISVAVRFAFVGIKKSYRPTPIFYGLCGLSFAFLLNGATNKEYTPMNLAFGFLLSFCFIVIYTLVSSSVNFNEENYKKIAFGFVAFSALLVIELAIKYMTSFNKIIVNGELMKTALIFGWGVWNNMGMFLSVCVPAVFLLAAKYKHGYLFILYAALLVICAFLTGSRQAMLGSVFAFLISAVAVLIKSRSRMYNAIVLGCIVLAAVIVIAVKHEKIAVIFKHFTDGLLDHEGDFSGNGRMRLYKLAVEYFKKDPVFGGGFFVDFELFGLGTFGEFFPTFAHNTFAELLGTCGIAGILAYTAHRATTVVAFFKKPSFDKFYITAVLLTFLLICLADNYIFYLLPTMVYSSLLPFATGNERWIEAETEN